MLVHLGRFALLVWIQVLAWNSATTFSIAKEAIIVPLLVLVVALRWTLGKDWYKRSVLGGRGGDVLKSFAITIGVVFALIGVCYVAAIPVVVYQDHIYLVASVNKAKGTLTPPLSPSSNEPYDSLRRRTLRLVQDVETFRDDRKSHHPPYTNNDNAAVGEQAEVNRESVRYDIETEGLCLARFEDRARGIVQELKAKGVDLSPGPQSGFFEAMVEQPRCLSEYQYKQFRDLAYHVDGADKLVVF